MMGSGKSTLGAVLSARTGWSYRDNDDLVTEISGLPTARLLDERGEDELRRVETAALEHVLDAQPPIIAGIAGGTIESEANRSLLRSDRGFVVYLQAAVEVLVERVGEGEGRPWLQPDPEAALRTLFEGREAHYRSVADLVLDTAEGTTDEQADLVLARFQASG
jgi:shikimate kinase